MKGVTSETQEKLGGYNSMPPNCEPISESEFLWKVSYKTPMFRQVQIENHWRDVYMFVQPDLNGVGYIRKYDGRAMRVTEDAYTASYFKWTFCNHEYETTHQGNCYWEGTCKKCGFHNAIDSSG